VTTVERRRPAREPTQLLDKSSPIPLYYQLFLRVQADILTGIARPGDLLGTEKAIQQRYGVSRATVRKALDELARHGRLERITGRGTFVAEPAAPVHTPHLLSYTEEMERDGRVPGSRTMIFSVEFPPMDAAEALRCSPTEQVVHIGRIRTADGLPVLVVHHYLAPFIQLESGDLRESLYQTLESRLGIRLQEAYHTVSAALAGADEAEMLDVAEGSPLLQFERTTLGADDRPVIYERGFARPDRYHYVVHLYRP
jgi:GntR family transcriptional regulator